MKFLPLLLFSFSYSLIIGQSIQSISPNSGMQGQMLTVSVTGQNTVFQQGTNSIKLVQYGTSIFPSSTNFIDDTHIDATFPLRMGLSPGLYDVVVENHLMTSTLTLPNGFTLIANPNPPTLSSISPTFGKQGDTVSVTIYGTNTNFNSGPNTISMYNGSYIVYASKITVINSTTLEVKFVFNNASAVGDYNIYVSNSLDDVIALVNGFHLSVGLHPAIIKSIKPNSGMPGQMLTVSITGQNTVFQQGSNSINMVQLIQGGTILTPVTNNVINDTLMYATFAFNPNHPLGLYDVVIDYYLGNSMLTLPNGFTLSSNPNPPSLASSSPVSGYQGNTVTITINGQHTNFNLVPNTVWIENGGYKINPSLVTAINSTTLEAKFIFKYSPYIGKYDIHVVNALDGGLVLNSAFDLLAGTNPPKLVNISPNNAMQGQTLTVSITGQSTDFQQASNVIKLIQGSTYIIPVNSTIINDTLINADFAFNTTHTPGLYNMVVNGYSLPNAFTLYSKVVSVSPSSATQGDTVIMIITGVNTHFGSATDSVCLRSIYGGKLLYSTSLTVVNSTTIKAKFIFKDFPFTGLYSVYVKNNTDGTNQINNAFTLNPATNSPAIIKVTPNYGWLDYLPVTMNMIGKNTHFRQGLDTVRLANETTNIYPIKINVINDTFIIANFASISIMITQQPFYLNVLVEGPENAILKNGFQVNLAVTVQELPIDENITLFPNPTCGMLNVVLNKEIEDAELSIMDMQGRKVYNQNHINSKSMQINLSGYQKGVYILKFGNIKYHIIKKIVIVESLE